ncbi:MAG: TolC family protein [Proteobacteria bacterium]|nr:TolC family protein [Pseudomonadota bacterium]
MKDSFSRRRAGRPVLAAIALVAIFPFLLARAVCAEPPSPLPLDWCLERAESENPGIAAEVAASEAAAHRVGPAGSLDDPRFSYEASNLPVGAFDFTSTPLSGHQFGLRQKLPFPRLLSNRKGAARAGAQAAGFVVEDRRLATASAVEAAWSELGFAQRALGITLRNIELLRQLAAVAGARYRVGSGLQHDVLRAQVELTTLHDQRLRRQASIEAASARLGSLLDLPAEIELPQTEPLADDAPLPELAPLVAGVDDSNPMLRALSARVEQASRLLRASELEGYPDLDLGVGYRLRRAVEGDPVNGDDFLSAGLTIRLPVDRSKWRSRVAERRALVRRAREEYRAARSELTARMRTAHAELFRAESQQALLETGLVPQARQSLESSRSGYQVGRLDFLSLLDSQVQLLEAELRLVRSRADRRQAFAALEAASGERLR